MFGRENGRYDFKLVTNCEKLDKLGILIQLWLNDGKWKDGF